MNQDSGSNGICVVLAYMIWQIISLFKERIISRRFVDILENNILLSIDVLRQNLYFNKTTTIVIELDKERMIPRAKYITSEQS